MFRLFFSDCGLLCAALDFTVQNQLFTHDHSADFGALFENVFAQALCANGFRLYYFNSKKSGEVDFVTENQNSTDLIEIKSGQNWTSHASISKVLKEPNWQNARAYVFCQDPGYSESRIRYLPWYMIMFYTKDVPAAVADDFNWESLSFPD